MVLSEGPQAGGALGMQALEAALEPILGLAVELTRTRARALDAERLTLGLHTGSAMVGNSPLMRRLQGTLSRAADCDVTVLIEGPAGAGKSLAARVVHCKSRRVGQPLVAMSCAELSVDNLMKAVETARATTLVLEDVEKLPLAAQGALVRHLKERNPKVSSPRLIVTTGGHLPELVAKGAFREDLLYRLHAFPIVVPALRERTEDIAMIATHVLQTATQAQGAGSTTFTPSALMLLESMAWPGNVSQLENTVWRARVLAGGGPIDREHLIHVPTAANQTAAPRERDARVESAELGEEAIRPFEEEEQELLTRALRATKGNVRRAAQLLGIGRATLYRKIQQYRLRLQ
ncbi:MAG: sigma-54-dependent Fis family transcriptional regulator [Planctomycetes bacterium]|nr:sigma-54-dependent Fis family transcriptional regulator [Planctomycetota bacterium]